MKLIDFVKKYSNDPIIDSSTFALLGENPQNLRCEVQYWLKHGRIIALKRGIYVLGEDLRKKPLSMGFIANYLLTPSYLSLEYALSYYDLIPEKVTVYTSVTTKKTTKYKTPVGIFEYRSVKESLFSGFTKKVDNGQDYFIAYPEKALLDFFYFHKDLKGLQGEFESFRFQNLEILNMKRFNELRRKYNRKTNSIAQSFMKFIRLEKKAYKTLK
jgi:predicted transcriptional regulator of viral defense system